LDEDAGSDEDENAEQELEIDFMDPTEVIRLGRQLFTDGKSFVAGKLNKSVTKLSDLNVVEYLQELGEQYGRPTREIAEELFDKVMQKHMDEDWTRSPAAVQSIRAGFMEVLMKAAGGKLNGLAAVPETFEERAAFFEPIF
jgi:hypothetical protein